MPPKPQLPPVEVDPQLAEIEEWEELQRQEAAARRAAEDEVDPQLAEIEESIPHNLGRNPLPRGLALNITRVISPDLIP
ncbi:hypothetical protein QYE76_064072 [Lolium multiflorum]|uniref:Uncharacterized protein n=1 Tax=Lolium multiflorum TaxID=4521 RepID=A0AAD8S674_LOLMU|nr:hypothetical protein QYE76_064072 [Lolium multiflorum]